MAEISPLIKIAPTKEEKAEKKAFQKELDFLGSEQLVKAADGTKVIKSRRNYDRFIGGPLHLMETAHAPNGPDLPFDKGRWWADYYIRDTMTLPGEHRRVTGYHLYSSSRALEYAHKHSIRHRDHKPPSLNLGTRGPNMVKLYYHCGFYEDELLYLDGIHPADFTGVLTLS